MADPGARMLLLIDNAPAQIRLVTALAGREGWRVAVAREPAQVFDLLKGREGAQINAAILDQIVPGDDLVQLIADLRERRPDLPILVLTGSTSPLQSVAAMRAGASDYLVKPVAPERLMQALRNATAAAAWQQELTPLSEKMPAVLDFEAMVGTAPSFRTALARAAKAARGHGSLLIEGERGTGKEMLVRAIHAASPRSRAGLRILNIAAIPQASLPSVLLGHEQGAFAGAFERHVGALQASDGATLVLDEVDHLSPEVQLQLAQVLRDRRVRPIGSPHGYHIDVRVIAASNLPLTDLASTGNFDEELLGLLSATIITVPPLRERHGDIVALARHFLTRIAAEPGLRQLGITDGALTLLSSYDWPGNVRQLQAVLFRAAVFCDGNALTELDFPQLAELVGDGNRGDQPPERGGVDIFTLEGHLRPLEEIEADVIRLAIGHYRGRMSEVARRLGIGRSTLYRKLSDLGIDNAV
ncbi:sigma-54 dependent transcriptional regulator [Croceibacterium sp. TMG7-5b_MA50]|uniref:sigma-54-dependent transcriptional regulator n=1 Tax=Croceibacterium sp. TMG7-5b_MA50 TaxID=3121290 RepID=UPI0032218143